MVTNAMAPEYTLIALAAIAPTAIANSVAFANGEASSAVNDPVGSASDAAPVVTEAAPTTSSTTHAVNSPAAAKNPVRRGDTDAGR